ncbi:MAG: hypothetical protein WD512_03305 [Candidatus Paceibacterota bacterium]
MFIPLLIREKVEFYQYRQVWLEKIKIMHKEYREKIVYSIYDNVIGKTVILKYMIDKHMYNNITYLEVPNCMKFVGIKIFVHNFVKRYDKGTRIFWSKYNDRYR